MLGIVLTFVACDFKIVGSRDGGIGPLLDMLKSPPIELGGGVLLLLLELPLFILIARHFDAFV